MIETKRAIEDYLRRLETLQRSPLTLRTYRYPLERLDNICRTPRKFQERVLLALCLEAGPRVSEIAGIRPWHVSDTFIALNGKTSPRRVPVSSLLTDAMKMMATRDKVWVNYRGKPMSHRDVTYCIQAMLERAGITGPKLEVHLLRHSFATHYAKGGAIFALQKILGHPTVKTTERYVHLAAVDVAQDQACHAPEHKFDLLQS